MAAVCKLSRRHLPRFNHSAVRVRTAAASTPASRPRASPDEPHRERDRAVELTEEPGGGERAARGRALAVPAPAREHAGVAECFHEQAREEHAFPRGGDRAVTR
jgi:hypothetical protein